MNNGMIGNWTETIAGDALTWLPCKGCGTSYVTCAVNVMHPHNEAECVAYRAKAQRDDVQRRLATIRDRASARLQDETIDPTVADDLREIVTLANAEASFWPA